jgi:hypothetical protein
MMANNRDLRIGKKSRHTLACDYEFGKAKKFKNIFGSAIAAPRLYSRPPSATPDRSLSTNIVDKDVHIRPLARLSESQVRVFAA